MVPPHDRPIAAPASPAAPLIVADIGGTNARFGWADQPGGAIEHVRTLSTQDHAGPGQAMRRYIEDLPAECHRAIEGQGMQAAWALAAIIAGDEISLTNNDWRFSRRAERQALSLKALHLYNDFEALAHALPHLGAGQVRSWDGRLPSLRGALAVVGPGTGLGVAGLLPTGSGWHAISGEGGHMTLSAADDFEAEVLRLARLQWPHVSAERLLSGIGLPLLHECVAQAMGSPASGEEATALSTESIFARGLVGEPRARRTLEVFCAMLGSFCGNVALTLGATGGVFIGGGLVPRLGDLFFQSAFRQRFEAKGRFEGYLAGMATVVITDTMVALRGASAAAAQAMPAQATTPAMAAPPAGAERPGAPPGSSTRPASATT